APQDEPRALPRGDGGEGEELLQRVHPARRLRGRGREGAEPVPRGKAGGGGGGGPRCAGGRAAPARDAGAHPRALRRVEVAAHRDAHRRERAGRGGEVAGGAGRGVADSEALPVLVSAEHRADLVLAQDVRPVVLLDLAVEQETEVQVPRAVGDAARAEPL